MIPAALALWLLAAAPARADGPADALADQALASFQAGELVSARDQAEAALAADPRQYRAHYVLGLVMRDAEGNLAQAMFHLGRSRELYETRFASSLDTDWRFHQALLDAVQIVAGEIEAYEYQLQILDYYDARFDPDLVAERAWPLMKLGRFDEAREAATRAILSRDELQRSSGMNAMCALEAEAGDRAAAYTACLAALDAERLHPEADVTVDAFNASLAARAALRFDEAVALALEADTGASVSTANPHAILAELAVADGRGSDAVAAIRAMQGWRARQPAHLRDQNRAETDAVFAQVLLAVGEPELGLDIITRAIDFPDRRALTSGTAEQARGGHALLRIALRRAAAERRAERAATLGLWGRLGAGLGAWVPDGAAWQDEAAVTAVLADRVRLQRTLRQYLDGGLPVPPWMVGELIPVVGPGVVRVALQRVRRLEGSAGFEAYHDALEAELAWWRGDRATCRRLAAAAASALPSEERLLRARVTAMAADSAWRAGDRADALSLYEVAMRDDPGVVRRLALALPAEVDVSGGEAAADAGRMLRRSPRFASAERAFRVGVTEEGGALSVCLSAPSGNRLSCSREPAPPAPVEGEAPPPWTAWDRAAATVDGFHRDAFSMRTGVSSLDLRGLDGTTGVNTEVAREQMQDLLDRLIAPPPSP